MGLTTEMAAELAWMKKLGDIATPHRATARKLVAETAHVEPCFDLADVLEQGLGPGPSSAYVAPPVAEQRLVVERGPNNSGFLLTTSDGHPLLFARSGKNGTEFQLFSGHKSSAVDDLQPMFLLRSNKEKTKWSLHSLQCEECQARSRTECGQRLLAKMTHYTEKAGDCTALCMDVQAPDHREDGSLEVSCTVCGDSEAHSLSRQLSTRRPTWNPRLKCMILSFNGRCSIPSAKNFQLETMDEELKEVKLLFGKVGEQKFVLDYRSPFGTAQAFAVALTTSHWT